MALRAYPGWGAAINNNVRLIEHFIRDLANLEVRREVSNVGPPTYQGGVGGGPEEARLLVRLPNSRQGEEAQHGDHGAAPLCHHHHAGRERPCSHGPPGSPCDPEVLQLRIDPASEEGLP